MKFERIKPGMVLYDVHREKMGNTTMSTVGVWPVYIVSVDAEKQTARVHWNVTFNPQQTYYRRQLERLRETEPVLVKSGWGHRLETRAEKKARLATPASRSDSRG